MALSFVNDSASIGTTEYWLASDSPSKVDQTDDSIQQVWIDFGAMAAGDVYEWRVVEKVNGNTQRNALGPSRVVGVQDQPVVITGLLLGEGWEVGVKKISGTDRTIHWSIRKAT